MSDSSSEEEYKPRAPAFAMLDDSESDDEYDMAAFAGRNKGGSNLAMLMSDSDEEDEAAASESEEEAPAPAPAPAPSKSKKGKKKNAKAQEAADDLDALMANIAAPTPKPAPAGGKKGKGKKGKGKKGPVSTADDDDLDALLASVETPKPAPATTAASAESKPAESAPTDAAAAFLAQVAPAGGSKKKKGKKGKGKQQAAPEEDLDAVLAALEAPAAQQPSSDTPAKEAAPQEQSDTAAPVVGDTAAADAAADFLADLNIDDSAGASKKKNKKKRPKKKAAPAAEKEDDNKPLSAVAKRAQERLKKVAAEREQREREEAERKRQEEEERKAREEEERKQAELKEQRAARRKAKKEEQLKSGTYMTKAQRQRAAAGRARLQAMIDAGMIAPGAAGIADGDSSPKSPVAQAKAARKTKKATASKAKPAPAPVKKVEEPQPKKPAEPAVDVSKTIAGAAAWDDSSDDEAKPSAAATVLQPGKLPVAVVAAAGGGAAWDADSDEEDIAAKKALHEKLTLKLNAERAGTRPANKTRAWDASSGDDVDSDDGSDDGSDDDSSDVDSEEDMERRIHESRERRQVRRKAAMEARDPDNLRSPIICIMGHVDTGKTKLLDKIRRTNVQEGEAGGITQQIGATFFPMDRLRAQTDKLNRDIKLEYKLPGLLVIDTPGHESFTNLRTRGSSLCDLAILVVDVMHGLEKQTLESLNILRGRKTPFIVALNKVDRMYGWKPNVNNPIRDTLAKQESYAISEFETRTKNVLAEFQAQGLNAKLYYENDDFKRNVSVVPTSAITGEGIPDLLMLLVQLSQQMMRTRMQKFDDVQCSLLEVKSIPGLGTTVDAILVNGTMREGDTIVACGMNGPIVTQVRALLTPKPMKEMRVKGEYVHHKSIEGSMGIKIAAHNLEKALAGTPLLVKHPEDEIEDLKEEVMEDLEKTLAGLARESRGVWVQASTLGSLEALMEYLRSVDPPVPVAGVNIGPVHKRDVIGASIMLEHVPEYAVILAFDVKITPEAAEQAEDTGVRIFTADIIYHLTDQFDQYMLETRQAKQSSLATEAVFPVVARIIPTAIFNAKSPIVVGMEVVEGVLKPGTPLCVLVDPGAAGTGHVDLAAAQMPGGVMLPNGKMILQIGRVASIENNHTAIPEVRAGGPNVAVKIDPPGDNPNLMIGRHFTAQHSVYSRITRGSIDVLKSDFREQMTKPDWQTVIALKKLFYID